MAPSDTTAVLLLSCRDQKGLVATVARFIYERGGNIVHADQHTDPEEGIFLQRVEWEMNPTGEDSDEVAVAFRPIAEGFGMNWRLCFSDDRPRLAIFVSKLGHCLYDLLARHRMGALQAEIPLIVSNHPDLLPVAERFGVDFAHLAVTRDTKRQQEELVEAKLQEYNIDVVGAGPLHADLDRGLRGALPEPDYQHPSFVSAGLRRRATVPPGPRARVKIIGATAHYVTADLDQGPIIEQDVTQVSHRDTVRDLMRKGEDLEKVVLARAVDPAPAQPGLDLRQQDCRLLLTVA